MTTNFHTTFNFQAQHFTSQREEVVAAWPVRNTGVNNPT
jgi:hypothetical protein